MARAAKTPKAEVVITEESPKRYFEVSGEIIQIKNEELKLFLLDAIRWPNGYSDHRAFHNSKSPSVSATLVRESMPRIYMSADRIQRNANLPLSVESFVEYVENNLSDEAKKREERKQKGLYSFTDWTRSLSAGDEVVIDSDGFQEGGIVTHVETNTSFFGSFLTVRVRQIVPGNTGPAEANVMYRFRSFRGDVPKGEVPVRPITAEQKATLTQRGRLMVSVTKAPTLMSLSGDIEQEQWYGVQSFRADGRFMVDMKMTRHLNADMMRYMLNHVSSDDLGDEDDGNSARNDVAEIDEADLWRCSAHVFGFSFSTKKWGRVRLSNLKPVNYRDDAFDKLVMDDGVKSLVHALVEHNAGTFTDIVEGKGGGTIFLLSGPPGVGKTLTCEAVAEVLHRPLYSVSVGELGTEPNELEKRLREILDVATVWNAVILLDEADIFLEQRNEHDILRNAMVGIFLRLLEYHNGVLFLTTNRAQHIDAAFRSRISMTIEYPEMTGERQEKVWRNLLQSAGVEGIDTSKLTGPKLNGRQIKSIIRLAQTVARARGEGVTTESLLTIVNANGTWRA